MGQIDRERILLDCGSLLAAPCLMPGRYAQHVTISPCSSLSRLVVRVCSQDPRGPGRLGKGARTRPTQVSLPSGCCSASKAMPLCLLEIPVHHLDRGLWEQMTPVVVCKIVRQKLQRLQLTSRAAAASRRGPTVPHHRCLFIAPAVELGTKGHRFGPRGVLDTIGKDDGK